MAATATQETFAQGCVDTFPQTNQVPQLDDDEWGSLEVNAQRIRQEAADEDWVLDEISAFPVTLLRTLSLWLGVDHKQTKKGLLSDLAGHIADDTSDTARLTIPLLREYVREKREGPIERLARHTLPEPYFRRLTGDDVRITTKKHLMVLSLFFEKKERLRTLMLYNRAERAGYVRHELRPDDEAEDSGDDEYEQVLSTIKEADTSSKITQENVNEALSAYEDSQGGRESRCFDVFEDVSGQEGKLVFILRSQGEEHIRQVDGYLFTDRADFFVIRLQDDVRVIDTHPRIRWDASLSAGVVGRVIDEPDVEYVQQREPTPKDNIESFLRVLKKDEDSRVQLYELDLEDAPISESPRFILRGEKETSLTSAIRDLETNNVRVLDKVDDINLVGVSFDTDLGTEGAYIFKFYILRDQEGNYFLPYSDAVKATDACRQFENYLSEHYGVHVFPGDRSR
ncbi:hypothetical protein [Salinibacter sp.]|uniref:hypothetical protein n=1 Tax=Salinibacter sp. TaxID=2065818 RepID=UPI0021E938D3|nr:hypothetical protein [Salinibacter sp.]